MVLVPYVLQSLSSWMERILGALRKARTSTSTKLMIGTAERVASLRCALQPDVVLVAFANRPRVGDAGAGSIAIVRQPASMRLRSTLTANLGSTKHGTVATSVTTSCGELVDLVEATAFAAQLLRGHPVYSACTLNDFLFALDGCDRLQASVGAAYLKAIVHQAAGVARGLLSGSHTDSTAAAMRWRQVGELLDAAQMRLEGVEAVDKLLECTLASPLDVAAADAQMWLSRCQQYVQAAAEAERAAPPTAREDALVALEAWLASLPVIEPPLPPPPPAATQSPAALDELLAALGQPKPAAQIISAVQSGSAMYGLSTPTSDCDYHLCYLASPTELLSLRDSISLRKLHFSRHVGAHYGAAKDGVLEYSAFELSHYLATLTKGNPSALELLFVPDEHAIARTWPWNELAAMRDRFVNDVAFTQYVGFIAVHIKRAQSYLDSDGTSGAAAGATAALTSDAAAALAKALYHTYVKLFECARIVRGEALHVRLRGEEHKLCWAIRTQPLVGELDAGRLLRHATDMLQQLKADKAQLATPLRGPPDMAELHSWMLSVRLRCLARQVGMPVAASLPTPPPICRDASSSSASTSAASVEEVGAAACERVHV